MNSKLSIFQFESKEVRIIMIDGEPWFVAKDVCEILGIKNVSDALSKLDNDEKRDGITLIDRLGRPQQYLVVSESGIKRLVSTSKKPVAKVLAKELGIEIMTPLVEAHTLLIISNSFKHLNPVDQFFVNGYRIDLYFPKQRIAVECDEYNHSKYNLEKEIKRQDVITKALGCQWVRYNPNAKNFCIGNVINQLIKLIHN